jgi:hypothetical protein
MWKYINYVRVIINGIMQYVNIKITSTVRFKVYTYNVWSHDVFTPEAVSIFCVHIT